MNANVTAGVPRRALMTLSWGLAALLVACGPSTHGSLGDAPSAGPPPSPPSPIPPPATKSRGGYFSGYVNDYYYAEAIITEEGEVRIYIQSQDSSSATEPIQFVGSLTLHDDGRADGTGVLIGERCLTPDTGRFCSGGVHAEVALDQLGNKVLQGSMTVYDATGDGHENWTISMSWPTDTYESRKAEPGGERGTYWEALADFAHAGDVVHSIDSAGLWFFQSAHTGCTGNGRLMPHADGERNVYDVELIIDGCDADYAYLNRTLTGLATRSFDDWGWWGDWLVFFLSSPADEQQPIALTMWGEWY